MTTTLAPRHLPFFLALTPEQAQRVANCVCQAVGPPPGNAIRVDGGQSVFDYCKEVEFDHSRVVLSLARESDEIGRGAIEALIGHPIKAWGPSVEAETAQGALAGAGPAPRPKTVDSRIVLVVKPNPRRQGTEASALYEHWRVGDTVQACLDRGLTSRSLRRDVRDGYVVLGAKEA